MAWTEITRRQYRREGRRYASALSLLQLTARRKRSPATPRGERLDMALEGVSLGKATPQFAGRISVPGHFPGWRLRGQSGIERPSTRLSPRVCGPVAQPDRATVS